MKHTPQNITARDPKRFWCAQSINPVLEKKLCTQFSLSNGLLGLRGSHEECPAWSDGGFYTARCAPRAKTGHRQSRWG